MVKIGQKTLQAIEEHLLKDQVETKDKVDPAEFQWFSPEEEIDLGKARDNIIIWQRGGSGIFFNYFDGDYTLTKIRFNNKASPLYPVHVGHCRAVFNKIYLTNTAQSGKKLRFIISYGPFAHFEMLAISKFYLSSGQKIGNAVIKTSEGYLGGFLISTNKVDDLELTLYDNPSTASGNELIPPIPINGSDYYGGALFDVPIRFTTGCYAKISGTEPKYTVYFR